jgi:hypothetical protein
MLVYNNLNHFILSNHQTSMTERASDQEVADFFEKHIKNPCGTESGDLEDFYKREAQRIMLTFTDKSATRQLEKAINYAHAIISK